eukprot:4005762-Alexandrium_andersonii.AAC.1
MHLVAAIRRTDWARRHRRIGALERQTGAARFWFPYRGGCARSPVAVCSMALQPGALPTTGVRSCSTYRQHSAHSELDVDFPYCTKSVIFLAGSSNRVSHVASPHSTLAHPLCCQHAFPCTAATCL